jgi:hypothetical protein
MGQYPSSLLSGLRWRDVGPMRGGRTYAVAGHADQPDTFYSGSVGGGVWKTENSGRTWFPVSDEGIPIGSIGAIAVAPSNPDIVYVGTGEPDIRSQNSYGIGMFKSMDAGKTWTHIGLEGTRQIGRVAVDPTDPNRVYVAALGHIYGANPERGVYRSLDGGTTWKKVLFKVNDPDNVGAIDLAIDPKNPRVLYASLWATRRPPWAVYAPTNLPGGGLHRSSDGGDTWKQLTGGLRTDDFVGKIGIAVSPSNPNRLWAVVDDSGTAVPVGFRGPARPAATAAFKSGGVYISDDAGATWKLVNAENRLWGRGWYFEAVTVDPTNPDRAYVMNTATFMTTDAGRTFVPVKGAPGGDDYHQLWVNPKDGNRMVLSSDQGTVVSVDGAKTWSTWYNQPTAQIYHVAADNRFPYWLYGAQQDSGAVGVSTWSREGVLSFRNWEPICLAGESDTVVPDPKDGNILYGGGAGRCDQSFNTAASLGGQLPPPDPSDPNRKTWTLPEVFSQADEALYYSNQFVFRSRDRGRTWDRISPDLARLNPAVPATLDPITAKDVDQPMTDRFGVVYSIGPSPLKAATVWVGTDDGLIYVTHHQNSPGHARVGVAHGAWRSGQCQWVFSAAFGGFCVLDRAWRRAGRRLRSWVARLPGPPESFLPGQDPRTRLRSESRDRGDLRDRHWHGRRGQVRRQLDIDLRHAIDSRLERVQHTAPVRAVRRRLRREELRHMDEAFPMFEKWGVAGLKIDFMDRRSMDGGPVSSRVAQGRSTAPDDRLSRRVQTGWNPPHVAEPDDPRRCDGPGIPEMERAGDGTGSPRCARALAWYDEPSTRARAPRGPDVREGQPLSSTPETQPNKQEVRLTTANPAPPTRATVPLWLSTRS